MSLHNEIEQSIRSEIDNLQAKGAQVIGPTALALRVVESFGGESAEPHIRYGAIEHCKQIARRILAKKFDADADENASYQGEMFTGTLQEWYPLSRKRGEEPQYKLLSLLTLEDLDFNIAQLRKSAVARVAHSDALSAYRDMRFAAA